MLEGADSSSRQSVNQLRFMVTGFANLAVNRLRSKIDVASQQREKISMESSGASSHFYLADLGLSTN